MRKPFFLVARPSKIPRPEDSTGGFLQGSTVHQIRVCIIIIIIVVIIISVFIIIIKIRITTYIKIIVIIMTIWGGVFITRAGP